MFGKNSKGIGAIIAVVVALAFMLMPVAQVNAQSTGITGAVENIGSAFGGMVEGLTNTLSSDFIMSIVESISTRIGRVFGAGLFVASTDNIFFRVIEWIVAFGMLLISQVVYELLQVVYIIPCISCAGVLTQTGNGMLIMMPLLNGLPKIFYGSSEGGFSWLGSGASEACNLIFDAWGLFEYAFGWFAHALSSFCMIIPLLNSVWAIIVIVIAPILFIIADVIAIILSAYSFIQGSLSSICTDCVLISRAMCRALLGV